MSTLFFATEARFVRGDAGIYTRGGFEDTLWERYLQVFDRIVVIARVEDCPDYSDDNARLIKNTKVSFMPVPFYLGPFQYLRVRRQFKETVKNNIDAGGSYICRVPGNVGSIVTKVLTSAGMKYGCEVVGDPWDVWSGSGPNLLLRPFLKMSGYRSLKRIVSKAGAVLYVTREALQQRYPASLDAFVTNASDVVINDDIQAVTPKVLTKKKDTVKLLCTGALAQMYKAPDVVLKAIRILRDNGYPVFLKWLGGGFYLEKMRTLSRSFGVSDYVDFVGSVQRSEVISSLSGADIFVMASRTEGMPRALIEAMAQGLPCIGTRVGGIPELLEQSVLIPKDSPEALATKVQEMIDNPDFANEQATRNLLVAQTYREDILQAKRIEFYKQVRDLR